MLTQTTGSQTEEKSVGVSGEERAEGMVGMSEGATPVGHETVIAIASASFAFC